MRRILTFVASHVMTFLITSVDSTLTMGWQWKDLDSTAVTVSPSNMDTTVTATSNPGTFFTMSVDGTNYYSTPISTSGSYILYVKAAADNDDIINNGSITISDDDSNADDLVITVSQMADPS